ncbi:Putative ribosomal protein S5 domain 2-type [Septoria linicola]|uniref:Ribosomal protein S5 domain 2-type n=1 Tax=Septoria linicola TaxID=215465 RepID=A0A9Q9AJQ4_9PEZI|nr:putative ribosomal protein S5 domain 2-type [Septoria linicola]USW47695.1 Putative ribosomal protein S5 domain 2-type [Septoria linicola]
MSSKRKLSDADEKDGGEEEPAFFRSAPIEDRQSTFIGFYSPSALKPKELQALAELKTADHKIVGWRRESNQQSIGKSKLYITGSDDDGEKYAGKKVEKVVEACQATGSVVVARWWGGIMLGPVRFTHIETAARDSIRAWEDYRAEATAKRRKKAGDEEERARLAKALVDRDVSIDVLRKLAADKEERLKFMQENGPEVPDAGKDIKQASASASSTKPPTDYTSLPLDRLRALDKARDATLSFLLKRIDKADVELKTGALGAS